MVVDDLKGTLRARISAARERVSPAQWARDDDRRTAHVLRATAGMGPGTVAVYVSRPGEPGTAGIIDGLLHQGWQVLIPKLRREPDWGWFPGWETLVPGWGDIPHPPGQGLGAEALARADLILLPALAVGRDGSRLGTGGGWYDRALLHRAPASLLVALTRTGELFDSAPTLPHDQLVHGHASEDGWVVR